MLNKPTSLETEILLKEKRHNLEVQNYATISGVKGVQFGRDIYSSVIKFKDLDNFLAVFPDVQRDLSRRRAGRIKQYILTGMDNQDMMRFFSAITVTCRGHIFFDDVHNRVALDTINSKLSINDGQHRFFGIKLAIEELETRFKNGRDREIRDRAKFLLDELREMVMPLVIFNHISEKEEKQLFHDINNLAQRPSRSSTIKLAQTDIFSRLAREIATENEYFVAYGVEMDKSSIHGNNENFVLLTTIYYCVKQMFWKDYLVNNNFINEDNYEQYKKVMNNTFNKIFEALPQDCYNKDKYILPKNYAMKGIVRFVHSCRYEIKIDEHLIYEAIKRVDWTNNYKKWEMYGAVKSTRGNILFSGGDGGIMAVHNILLDALKFKSTKEQLELLEENAG